MAALPSYVTVLFGGYGETISPAVERSEMERGMAKQVVLNTRPVAEINARLLFKSEADAASFETWYMDDIGRIDFFDVVHPRTGATISARFKGGDIGRLIPMIPDFSWSQRDVVLEYLR